VSRRGEQKREADNPDLVPLAGGGMDEFIVLIGTDQQPGSTDGHSLYVRAEQAEELYGERTLLESAVNSQLKLLYVEGSLVPSRRTFVPKYSNPAAAMDCRN
jgi:hypothetical protein